MGPAGTVGNVKAKHHGGRLLDASVDAALRQAALATLAEVGYDRLTMDAVAARAHAGKSTIYRRWPGKAELIVDALEGAKWFWELPNTGSLAGDLKAVVETIACADNQIDARVVIGMATAGGCDAELRRVFKERLLEPQSASIRRVFERAVVRGEIPSDRDLDLLVLLLPSLMLRQLLISGEMPEVWFAQRIVDEVILPLATAPTKDTPPTSNTPAQEAPKEIPCRS